MKQVLGQEFVNPLAPVIPQGTATNEMHVPPSNFSQPTNVLDEFMAEANNVVDVFKPFFKGNSWKEILLEILDLPPPSDGSLQQNQTLPLTTQVEGQSTQAMLQNVTRDVTPTIDLATPNASIPIFGQGTSQALGHQELGGNMGVVNPILSSNPNSTFPLPQNNPYSWTAGSSGMNNTSVGLGISDPQGGGTFDNATGNTLARLQSSSSPSFSVIPHKSSSGYQDVRRYHRFEMTGVSSLGQPADIVGANIWVYPEHNQHRYFRRPPSLTDFPDFVDAWQVKSNLSHYSIYIVGQFQKLN